jgi:uncharacterized protein
VVPVIGENNERDGNGDETSCIIIFVKFPEPGKVKTRLSPPLTPEQAAELYRCMVLDHLDTLDSLDIPTRIFFTPADSRERCKEWLGADLTYLPQEGGDLGERMANAFTTIFEKGYDRVVLVGSDIPQLTTMVFIEAFEALESHDAVIGPTMDGGYYLIGFREETFLPEVFEGISWSSENVFDETTHILSNNVQTAHLLSPLNDIDTIQDLNELSEHSANSPFLRSQTLKHFHSIFHSGNDFK